MSENLPDATTVITGLAGITIVGGTSRDAAGALLARNLGDAGGEEGLFLDQLPVGGALQIRTANHEYRLTRVGSNTAELSGHEKYCPQPVLVRLHGTRWLDSEMKECYLAPGMKLHFVGPGGISVLTSAITSLRQVS